MKIKLMPKHMADLIAAGEVVERPASVVKELMENAIDAGAASVLVEIQKGGIQLIRVTDDGCGIAREDLPLAFLSHATSKISKEEDLEAIGTLGFRGEALASICAVSRVEVLTREPEAETGTWYEIHGGEEQETDDAGCPQGTTVIVRDLFYNTPARMKFLKRDVTEANYVAAVVDKIALSHPEVAVRFIREGKQQLTTAGDGNLYNTIFSIFGKEFASGLIPVSQEQDGIKVHGYISKPHSGKPNHNMQYFFVGGRQVKSPTCTAALEQAYKNSMMAGKFPACVLHVEVPLQTVDVNVHPAKIEVRFADERKIFHAVFYAAKNAILEGDTPKQAVLNKQPARPEQFQRTQKAEQMTFAAPKKAREPEACIPKQTADFWQKTSANPFIPEASKQPEPAVTVRAERVAYETVPPEPKRMKPRVNIDIAFDEGPEKAAQTPQAVYEEVPEQKISDIVEVEPETEQEKPFRVLGEVLKTYIIVEQGSDVLLIDKHAAHERMLYEELKAAQSNESQMLLEPVSVTLSKEDYAAVLQNLELLEQSGFLVEDFGMGTVRVREYPLVLEQSDISDTILEIAGHLAEQRNVVSAEALDWLYHNVACRAAIKAGTETKEFELRKFVEKLLSMPEIRYCPHGRPVLIKLTKYELEKQFGRIG